MPRKYNHSKSFKEKIFHGQISLTYLCLKPDKWKMVLESASYSINDIPILIEREKLAFSNFENARPLLMSRPDNAILLFRAINYIKLKTIKLYCTKRREQNTNQGKMIAY